MRIFAAVKGFLLGQMGRFMKAGGSVIELVAKEG